MTGSDRDPVVARALRELQVPDHGPRFWDELGARLDAVDRDQTGAPADDPVEGAPIDIRVATSELPAVTALRPPPPSRHRGRFLAAAAAVAVVALSAGILLRGDGERGRPPVEQAGPTATDPTIASADEPFSQTGPASSFELPPLPTSTTGRPEPIVARTPADAVVRYTDALAAGDLVGARSLLGPRSLRYMASAGIDVDEYLITSGEGHGAWAAARPAVHEVEVPGVGAVVVYEGVIHPEGMEEHRVEAFPAVERDGAWFVEPNAFSTEIGGRITLSSPEPGEQGWSGLPPAGAFEAWADGSLTHWFSVDGDPAAEGPGGVYDPPGDLASGTHLLVVAAADDTVFTAVAGTFLVEG